MTPNSEEIFKRCISDLAYKFGEGKKKVITRLFNKQLNLLKKQSSIEVWLPSLVTGKVYRALLKKYKLKEKNKEDFLAVAKESYENLPRIIKKKNLEYAFKLLAEGNEINYSAKSGRKGKAKIVLDSGKKIKYEKIELNIFFYLEKERLISLEESCYDSYSKRNLAFDANYFKPVDVYKISYLGKSLINSLKSRGER